LCCFFLKNNTYNHKDKNWFSFSLFVFSFFLFCFLSFSFSLFLFVFFFYSFPFSFFLSSFSVTLFLFTYLWIFSFHSSISIIFSFFSHFFCSFRFPIGIIHESVEISFIYNIDSFNTDSMVGKNKERIWKTPLLDWNCNYWKPHHRWKQFLLIIIYWLDPMIMFMSVRFLQKKKMKKLMP
jgi:hypothetical protein